MFVRSGNDALGGFGTLHAEDLVQAASLHLVTSVLQLLLADRLCGRLLLQQLHQFHVEGVALLNDDLLRFRLLAFVTTTGPGLLRGVLRRELVPAAVASS